MKQDLQFLTGFSMVDDGRCFAGPSLFRFQMTFSNKPNLATTTALKCWTRRLNKRHAWQFMAKWVAKNLHPSAWKQNASWQIGDVGTNWGWKLLQSRTCKSLSTQMISFAYSYHCQTKTWAQSEGFQNNMCLPTLSASNDFGWSYSWIPNEFSQRISNKIAYSWRKSLDSQSEDN